MYTKPLDICYDFAAVLNFIFDPLGSTMVLLGRQWYMFP